MQPPPHRPRADSTQVQPLSVEQCGSHQPLNKLQLTIKRNDSKNYRFLYGQFLMRLWCVVDISAPAVRQSRRSKRRTDTAFRGAMVTSVQRGVTERWMRKAIGFSHPSRSGATSHEVTIATTGGACRTPERSEGSTQRVTITWDNDGC